MKEISINQLEYIKNNYFLSEEELAKYIGTSCRTTIRRIKERYNIPKNSVGCRKGCIPQNLLIGYKKYLELNDHPMKGRKHKLESIEKIKRNHANLKGINHPMFGKHHKKETIEKMIKNHKGMLGRHQSEEMKRKYRIKRVNWNFPKKDSTIEIKIQNFLKRLNIEFFTHFHISEIQRAYQCDIFIKPNIIIECDGDYWHGNINNPKFKILNQNQINQREKDIKRDKELIEKGYIVIRLWEKDIRKMTLKQFRDNLFKLNHDYFQDKNNSYISSIIK